MEEIDLSDIKTVVKRNILDELPQDKEFDDQELYDRIDRQLFSIKNLTVESKIYLRKAVFNSFRRLDVLSELLDNPQITEIMINSEREIFVEKQGHMQAWNRKFESRAHLEEIIQSIVSKINRTVNTSSPIVDARLPDGSRVHVVLPPVAMKGPTMTIRKFPEPITMDKLVAYQSLTRDAAAFLQTLVAAGYNIFISGGTNSGKTTFLNALSQYIPKEERVITIEDSAELQIRQVPNLVSLETRNENAEGEGRISMADLIRASLRMSPNRIIVGEVRGGEALDMLNAMNTGHDGSLSTGHANSARDMLSRLEVMVLSSGSALPLSAIRRMIGSAIEIIVHLGRTKDRKRRVMEISEVRGMENGEIRLCELYRFNGETLEKVSDLENKEKLLLRL